MAPRSGHQGYAWQRMKSAGTQPVRGEGGSWWTTDTPIKHIPRSLSRYQVKGKQAMKIKLHVRTCKCNKTIEKHLRTRGAPMGEIHGLLLPVARRGQRIAWQSGEARAGRQTFWGPCPLPATGTLPPSLPPSERSKKTARENVPREWGWEEGRNSEEHSYPGKQEGKSLSFQPPAPAARRQMTSPAGWVQLPRQESLAWATEGQPHPPFPSPHPPGPTSPPE